MVYYSHAKVIILTVTNCVFLVAMCTYPYSGFPLHRENRENCEK